MAASMSGEKVYTNTLRGLKARRRADKLRSYNEESEMKFWRRACGTATASLLFFSTSAGTASGANGAPIGSVNARPPAQKMKAAVDEVFEDLTRPGSPGCALGVYRDGQMLYEKGYGLANIEEDVAITPKSVFDIGSTSKQFTAASILLLEKQGKLSVNDDVRKYLPELPDYGKKITILHLLNHTSGLRDYLTLMDLAGIDTDSVTTDGDALALIVRQRALNFDPGSEWLYSNTGFFLLSVIVKRVSGKSLKEFAADNIFTPLGMTHTEYRDSHTALIPDRAMAYDEKKETDGYSLNVSYFEQTGDGAVHTSVEDLLKWDENFYSGQVGGKIYLADLQERGKLNGGKFVNYAKGLVVSDYRGLHTVRHGGSWGGYRAELLRFPDQHFSVACLCNVGNAEPSRRANQVADVYLGSLMKAKDVKEKLDETRKKENAGTPPSVEQLQTFAGNYWSEELGVSYRLAVADGSLKVLAVLDRSGLPRANNFSPNELRPAGRDNFTIGGDSITMDFKRDAKGEAQGFVMDAGRTTGVIFKRAETTAP
jgi:CubicO group peptidase (beta-lactamase class C family)